MKGGIQCELCSVRARVQCVVCSFMIQCAAYLRLCPIIANLYSEGCVFSVQCQGLVCAVPF